MVGADGQVGAAGVDGGGSVGVLHSLCGRLDDAGVVSTCALLCVVNPGGAVIVGERKSPR